MSCKKKEPCSDCPWRKNALPGWLGNHDVDYFHDVFEQDFPYPCHQTMGKPNEHICTGLVFTRVNSCKISKYPGPLKETENALRDVQNNCFDNIHQFKDYHSKFKKK